MREGRPRTPHPATTLLLGAILLVGVTAVGAVVGPAGSPSPAGPPDETGYGVAVLTTSEPGGGAPVSLADVVREACRGLVDADAKVLRARATFGDERVAALVEGRRDVLEVQDDLRWDDDVTDALDAYAAALDAGDLDALGPVRAQAHDACQRAEADPG